MFQSWKHCNSISDAHETKGGCVSSKTLEGDLQRDLKEIEHEACEREERRKLRRRRGQAKDAWTIRTVVSRGRDDVYAFYWQFDPRTIELRTKWYSQLHKLQMENLALMCSRDVVTDFRFKAVHSVVEVS